MSVHEFAGKTTEEAINEGLRQLGVTISDVKVEVLDEGAKGLFGLFGSKQARVRMTLEERNADIDSLLHSLSSLDPASPAKTEPKKRDERPMPAKPKPAEKVPAAATPAKPVEKVAEPLPKKRPAKERVETPDTAPKTMQPVLGTEAAAPAMPLPVPEMRDPGTPAGKAQQFLMKLTQLMHVTVAVEVFEDDEGHIQVKMTGDTLGILIGRRGETLDALQYLTSLHINRAVEGYIRVTLDTENYRAKREESLKRLATRMAARAVKTNRRVALEPMNPYERRILHSALQGHPQVTTHSEGEEPNRRVVITLKSDEK